MLLLLEIFGVLCVLELLVWLPAAWRYRKLFTAFLISANAASLIGFLIYELKLWVVLLVVVGLYRLINLARVFVGRTQPDYLYHSSLKTSLWLIGSQVLIVSTAWLIQYFNLLTIHLLYVLAVAQVVFATVLLTSTFRHLRTTLPTKLTKSYADKDLPSLTVAIPARNETADLEACLRTLIACEYPKLEILVLDDCSQTKRTPEIIRSFAHDGVRFVAGAVPPNKWLAKNYAYQQLTEAASGELLLFCGVDVRFGPSSLNRLVETLLQKQKSMISLIPENAWPNSWKVTKLLTQPNRYAWELALPRKLFKRPPVLSTCWLIKRETLLASGSFAAVIRQPVPESYFASQTAARDDGYSFLQSSQQIDINSLKNTAEQLQTAIRTRYPQLHRRLELVMLLSAAEFIVLAWPLILLVAGVISGELALAGLAGFALILQSITYSKVVRLTYRKPVPLSVVLSVPAALYDIWLLNYSMWQYEFSEVIWKDRNVCIPVMRVIPNLPKS